MNTHISTATSPTYAISPIATRVWAGRALSAIAVSFLCFDAAVKLLKLPIAVDTTVQMGFSAAVLVPLGMLEVACLAIYLIPRLAPLGAVLWTAYLGGAVATHVRLGDPLFSHVLFPTYVAAMLWAGLWLRDASVRALLGRAARTDVQA
jgi:hypothetical protein